MITTILFLPIVGIVTDEAINNKKNHKPVRYHIVVYITSNFSIVDDYGPNIHFWMRIPLFHWMRPGMQLYPFSGRKLLHQGIIFLWGIFPWYDMNFTSQIFCYPKKNSAAFT
jgi:hypothetical protein